MPKFEDIIILVAAAGVAVAAGVFWTSRRAVAAPKPSPNRNRWLSGSNGANAAPAAWASLPGYVMQDPRADYSIFTPATDITGNPIDIAHANTQGGYQ